MPDSIYIAAFIVGFLGGVHCLGMCGGIVGALTFNLKPAVQLSWWRTLPYQLVYNSGRISSYVVVGALFGFLGASITSLAQFLPAQQILQTVAGIFMIVLGLYLGGWWNGVVAVERAGTGAWQKIQPLAQKLIPVKNLPQAWAYGFVWGWIPCGLVYSMLIMALSSGGATEGAMVMLAFGLGTLPNLMLMGVFAFYFTRLSQTTWVRQLAGISVILMGLWQFYLAWTIRVA